MTFSCSIGPFSGDILIFGTVRKKQGMFFIWVSFVGGVAWERGVCKILFLYILHLFYFSRCDLLAAHTNFYRYSFGVHRLTLRECEEMLGISASPTLKGSDVGNASFLIWEVESVGRWLLGMLGELLEAAGILKMTRTSEEEKLPTSLLRFLI